MKKLLVVLAIILLSSALPAKAQTPYIGDIKMVGFNFAPRGWALCEGQLLPIAQYNALFSLLGTTYGGDGRTTFALPDLRGRAAVGAGTGPGLTNRRQGAKFGQEFITLSLANLPAHTHQVFGTTTTGTSDSPANALYADTKRLDPEYGTGTPVAMSPSMTGFTGGASQSVINLQPSVGIYYVIALEGLYPSRN